MADTLDSLCADAARANAALAAARNKLTVAKLAVRSAVDDYAQAVIAWSSAPPSPTLPPGQAKKAQEFSPVDAARARLDKAIADFASVRRTLGI